MKDENKNTIIYKNIIIGTVGLLFGILLLNVSLSKNNKYVVHYSDSSKLDYNVYLKQNDFYTVPFLPKDKQYVSTLIDYIDADFNYKFDVIEDTELYYNYSLKANVVVDGIDGKNIYSKEEDIIKKTNDKEITNNKFSISENVKIDYNRYNKLASSFIDSYGISANAKVIVSMNVSVKVKETKYKNKLNDSSVISLEIPLTTLTTDIKMNYDLANNNNKEFQYANKVISHPILLFISVIVILGDIIWIGYNGRKYLLSKTSKERYDNYIQKILKNYGRYISKKSTKLYKKDILYTQSLRIEPLESFEDLMNVRDNVEKPILFYEAIPGEQAVFYIIDTQISYIYIVSINDFIRGKRNKNIGYNQDFLYSKIDSEIL